MAKERLYSQMLAISCFCWEDFAGPKQISTLVAGFGSSLCKLMCLRTVSRAMPTRS